MIDFHGIRRITDDHGVLWEVWEAHPKLVERRRMRERRRAQRAGTAERRIAARDERQRTGDTAGWLVFRSAREERRRTPIPAGWETMPAERLVDVLRGARSTAPFPRMRLHRLSAS